MNHFLSQPNTTRRFCILHTVARIALGHDADLNLDAAISPAELLIALLTQLVRKAHLDETTLAYVARL